MIRTFLVTAALSTVAISVHAQYLSPSQRALAFATCAGRYAAEDSQWDLETAPSPERELFESLLEATLPDAIDYGMPASEARSAKMNAWRAHSYLRNDSDYALDSSRRDRAAAQRARNLETCKALVL